MKHSLFYVVYENAAPKKKKPQKGFIKRWSAIQYSVLPEYSPHTELIRTDINGVGPGAPFGLHCSLSQTAYSARQQEESSRLPSVWRGKGSVPNRSTMNNKVHYIGSIFCYFTPYVVGLYRKKDWFERIQSPWDAIRTTVWFRPETNADWTELSLPLSNKGAERSLLLISIS